MDPNLKFTDNFINLDLRFSKTSPIGNFEVKQIVEIFNVFNVTSITEYVNNESNDFGRPASTAGGAFGAGGSWTVQFALRLKFRVGIGLTDRHLPRPP